MRSTPRRRSSTTGGLFGIYPEGTRSHDGKLYRGKTGVARLALETKVPVVPVAVVGTDVVAPPGKKFGAVARPVVRFGKPLDFSRYEGLENDRFILRSITDEIMYEIMRLSGQEYVDLYATQAKARDKEAAAAHKNADRWPRAQPPADDRRRPGPRGLTCPRCNRPVLVVPPRGRVPGGGWTWGERPSSADQVGTSLFRALAILRFVVLALRRRRQRHPLA